MPYRIIFAPEAERQLLALYGYIAGEASPDIADRFVAAIIDRCKSLETFPDRGSPRDDIRPGIRTFAFRRRVTVAYMVHDDRVVILGISYRGQQLAALLSPPED